MAAETASCPESVRNIRAALMTNGVLVSEGEHLRFSQDYVFNSPSTAAGVVLAASINGRTEWKSSSGQTLKQIQELSAQNP